MPAELPKTITLLTNSHWLDLPVNEERHPGDGMFSGDTTQYLSCGKDALFNIALAQVSAGVGSPRRVLDFACGFGRVARYLRAGFPDAEITFSDVMPVASAFCSTTFAGRDEPINKNLVAYEPGRRFDLIWVGSLFTHLPEAKSSRLLELLLGVLEPQGLLVCTSHGRYIKERRNVGKWPYAIDGEQYDALIAQTDATGYGFVPYESQTDYGISLASLGWWERTLSSRTETRQAEIIMVRERGWVRHQDVIAIRSDPG